MKHELHIRIDEQNMAHVDAVMRMHGCGTINATVNFILRQHALLYQIYPTSIPKLAPPSK